MFCGPTLRIDAHTAPPATPRARRPGCFLWRFTLLLALLWPVFAPAQDLLPVPPLSARVMDRSGTLAPAELQALEAKLAAFEAEHGTQIVILMLPSTGQEDIAAYAYRVADQWKIGRRQVGDGILMVVAKDDRRVRIEVARTLEGAVPDLAAFQIINRAMAPAFRDGDYAGGLNAAVDALMARVRGEELPLPERRAAPQAGSFSNLALLLFMGVPVMGAMLIGVFGRKLGALVTGGGAGALSLLFTGSLLLALLAAVLALVFVLALGVGGGGRGGGRGGPLGGGPVIWGGGRRGGFGGGLGGGGFRSGGGGSFGGGGASGRW